MPRYGRMNRPNEKSKDFFGTLRKLFLKLGAYKYILMIALVLALISAIFSIIAPNILSNFTDIITEGIKPDENLIKDLAYKITNNMTNIDINSKYQVIMNSNIDEKDKDTFKYLASSEIDETFIYKVPTSIQALLIDNITYKDVELNYIDQLSFIKILSDKENVLNNIDNLTDNVKKIITPSINMEKIKTTAITLGILYGVSALFSYIQGISMATISNNFARKLRNDISKKINVLPLLYFDNHETGDILSRVTNDVDTIGMNMNQSLATLVSSTTLFIGSLIMMFTTEWRMALVAILSSLVGFMFMIIILKNSQKYFIQRQVELGNMNGYIEEMYSGYNVVKAYNGTNKAIEDFDELNNKLYTYNQKSQFLSGIMQPIMGFVGNFGYVAVCIVGALLVSNNMITFGVIVAFMIYVRLFTNPLSQIAQAMTNLQSTAAASERVFEFLEEKEQTDESNLKPTLNKNEVKGSVEFKNVKFGYNENKTIIHNFNAKIKPGQKIAIVGPTGAGKTTMVNLLMKFYEINDGDILIDNVSIHDIPRETIHELFVMVLQDTWLFDGTIKENLKFNKSNVTDEELWEACKYVGIDHFIKTLPNGIDSKISDNDSISQGQKQLLTITRGLIENGPLLILDEATSNVDTRTEELVQKAMDKLTKGRTSFIIAHRLSTIKNADLILVMKDGDIIESGTHENLMEQNGFYADLYNSQFQL